MPEEISSKIKKPRTPRVPQPVAVTLGTRVKKLRIAADMSQLELAFDCKLDRTVITAIERGVANPSLLTLASVAQGLKISLSDLFEGNVHAFVPDPASDATMRRSNQAPLADEVRPQGTRRSRLR